MINTESWREDDPRRPAAGVLNGLILGAVVWLVVIAAALLVYAAVHHTSVWTDLGQRVVVR